MKNQALTITLAILLAISLSALTALVVSSEVAGGSQTVVNEAPIAAIAPAESTDSAAPATVPPATTANQPAAPAPAVEAPAEAPAQQDVEEAPVQDDAPRDTDQDDTPVDDEEADASADADDDAPVEDEEDGEPADDDEDDDDGATGPDISILCAPGYKLVDLDCVFVGCPLGTFLNADGICDGPVLQAPCPDGETRLGGICLPDLVVTLPDLDPICLAGFTVVDGVCVTVCPDDHNYVGGFCLPGFETEIPKLDLDLAVASN